MDIKETKELVAGICALIKAGVQIGADGKIGLDDLGALMPVFPAVIAALDGVDKVPSELGDLNDVEVAELVAYVMDQLSVADGKAKQVVVAALKVATAVWALVGVLKAPAAPAVA